MKYLLLLSLLFMFGCSKEDVPEPANPPKQAPSPPPTSTMNAVEQALLGFWIHDSTMQITNNGDVVLTTKYTNNCHLELNDIVSENMFLEGIRYSGKMYLACVGNANPLWRASSDTLLLGNYIFKIHTLTNNNLIFEQWVGSQINHPYLTYYLRK
jgi:hypothetical protein